MPSGSRRRRRREPLRSSKVRARFDCSGRRAGEPSTSMPGKVNGIDRARMERRTYRSDASPSQATFADPNRGLRFRNLRRFKMETHRTPLNTHPRGETGRAVEDWRGASWPRSSPVVGHYTGDRPFRVPAYICGAWMHSRTLELGDRRSVRER